MVHKSRNLYSRYRSEVFNLYIKKGMVMSGINYVRTSVKFVALFVEKRRVIGWYFLTRKIQIISAFDCIILEKEKQTNKKQNNNKNPEKEL